MFGAYEIMVEGDIVRISVNEELFDANIEKFFEEFRRKIPKLPRWRLLIDQSTQKSVDPRVKLIIQELFQIAAENEVDRVVHVVESATANVHIKRLGKRLGLSGKIFGATSISEAQAMILSKDAAEASGLEKKPQAPKRVVTRPSRAATKEASSKKEGYHIEQVRNGIHFEFFELMTVDHALKFVDEFKTMVPNTRNWYVMADMRRAKVVSQDVSRILNQATDFAHRNGRQFSVQIVDSPTTKLQLKRVAREKGEEDHFFVVTSRDEAEKIIEQQKMLFGMF